MHSAQTLAHMCTPTYSQLAKEVEKLQSSVKKEQSVSRNKTQLLQQINKLKQESEVAIQAAVEQHKVDLLNQQEHHESIILLQSRGLSGLNLVSDDYHADHPGDAQRYFGFPSWQEAKVYIRLMWPGADQSQSSRGYATRTHFEQILIAKMFMKTALDQVDLARIWDTSRTLISKILLKWCPRWGEKSRMHVRLQNLPMHFLESSQPEGFAERYHTIPATETDGKDLRMENIRKDNVGKRLQNSSKYSMASLRWLAWSIPGTGLTTLVTDLFAARISECELVRLHSKWLIIFPPGTSRLVDRGFAFCTAFYPNLNIAFVPAFMRGRNQMFPIEIINARRMSQDRYTCECVFSRVSQHKLLKGILRYVLLHICPVNCMSRDHHMIV